MRMCYFCCMEHIVIKKAGVNDVSTIQHIGRTTFFETFADRNSEENMQAYLEESFREEKVKRELENPDSLFFVAWDGDEAVGYLKVNFGDAQTDVKDERAMEIERIYVRHAYFGKKVGQLLYEQALAIAKEANKQYVWLGVWEENARAIRFYEKNGFVAFDKHIFMVGDDEQTDVMMRREVFLNPS